MMGMRLQQRERDLKDGGDGRVSLRLMRWSRELRSPRARASLAAACECRVSEHSSAGPSTSSDADRLFVF